MKDYGSICLHLDYLYAKGHFSSALTAEADKQLKQWLCTYMEMPGACWSHSRTEEERATVLSLFITAQGNYKHLKSIKYRLAFLEAHLKSHSIIHSQIALKYNMEATQSLTSFSLCSCSHKQWGSPGTVLSMDTHLLAWEISYRDCMRKPTQWATDGAIVGKNRVGRGGARTTRNIFDLYLY